ncbi:hypothetical protein AB0N05_08725 [Nocardia sp. NPDC051030]|uniref:hypothetical protein n=1 Tax=Nocardia sp. NPDC051030 TaxID=3155162 RepID=UPI00342147BA
MNTWRDLDPATRKALLRGEPATDPEIDRIARAYAEQTLNGNRVQKVLAGLAIGLALGFLLGVLLVRADLGITSAAPAVVLVGIVGICFGVRIPRRLALVRILNVSNGMPRELVTPGSTEPLETRLPTRGVLQSMARMLWIFGPLLGVAALWSNPWLLGIILVLAVPVVAYFGYLLFWSLSGRPTTLDTEGIHTQRTRIAWHEVLEIRLTPVRASEPAARQVIAFVLHDNEIFLRQLSAWTAFFAKLNIKTYQSPIAFMDGLVDKPVDEIAASAAALSGLAVSRVQRS